MLDNIGIVSPNGIPPKANTSKVRAAKRMKSNESKRSNGTSKPETTINTQELAKFFEHRISKKEQFRKQQPKKKYNSFLQKNDIQYATPKINSNYMLQNKNATMMLDYKMSNQSFGSKSKLNNTMVVTSSYRSGSRKRDNRRPRISWGNHSIVANSEMIPLSQQKLMDMVAATGQTKKLESAYYPMKLKRSFLYDPKVLSKLQKFPGMFHLGCKKGKFKSKRKSPHSLKTHHNLYVAYIKGNARRVKAVPKGQLSSASRGGQDKRLNSSINPNHRSDHLRKSSHGGADSAYRRVLKRGTSS